MNGTEAIAGLVTLRLVLYARTREMAPEYRLIQTRGSYVSAVFQLPATTLNAEFSTMGADAASTD